MKITPAALRPLIERNQLRPTDLLSPDQPLKPYPPVRPWRYNAGIRASIFLGLMVVLTLLFAFAFGALVAVIMTSQGADEAAVGATINRWGNVMLIPGSVVAYLLLTMWWEQRRPPYELAPRRAAGLGWGVLLGAVLCTGSIGLLALFGAFKITGVDGSYNPVWAILTVGVSAAINEEIWFRGILFRLVEDGFGTWIATAVSAVFFGAVHLTNPNGSLQGAIAIALEAGVLFAMVYALTRSLWVVMGLHFAWNVVQGPIFGIVVSGSSDAGSGWFTSTLTGPAWLAGGDFGMEASLVTVVLLVLVAGWLGVMVVRNHLVVAPFWVRKRRLAATGQAGAAPTDEASAHSSPDPANPSAGNPSASESDPTS